MVLALYGVESTTPEEHTLELLRGFDLLPLIDHADGSALARSSIQVSPICPASR